MMVMEKYAMGVGFELAMACDIRLALKGTLLALPEVTLGQIPGSGGSQRVARIAGLTRAADMMMLGRRVPAEEALTWGLVTRVADARDHGPLRSAAAAGDEHEEREDEERPHRRHGRRALVRAGGGERLRQHLAVLLHRVVQLD